MTTVIRRTCPTNCKCNTCFKLKKHGNCGYHSSSSSSSEDDCTKRMYRDKSNKLRSLLGKKQYKHPNKIAFKNAEEIKYKSYNYNGLFHKPLAHNTTDGRLIVPFTYEVMRNSVIKNDQLSLANLPLAAGSTFKLSNPLGSWATVLAGMPQNPFDYTIIDAPPSLSSDAGAADMVELYCLALARDVPFTEFNASPITDPTLISILDNLHMNKPDVLANLRYYTPASVAFDGKTLFRGISAEEKLGPYVSQFLLLNIPMGANTVIQKNTTLLPRPNQCEWGVNLAETVNIQNGTIGSFASPAFDPTKRYVFDGRSLAEYVHNDNVYQIFFNAGVMMQKLGAQPNPGMPVYANQSGFVTGLGGVSLLCAIAEASALALKHAWFVKWQLYRKLRPEVFGLWIHDVLAGIVPNLNNFDISNVVFNNSIMTDIFGLYGSYTLPQCFPEGAPCHPSYVAGHAAIAGACTTIIKMFFDCEQLWSSLPGVTSGVLSGFPGDLVEADITGANLQSYNAQIYGSDAVNVTITGELDKMASNVAIGRNWAGVHYRSDGVMGMNLGESVAIKYMEDLLSTMVENKLDGTVPTLVFKKFNGDMCTVKPTVCKLSH